jgi:FKBP-type peptidyl-prolyl cis-trans isomerase
LHDTQSGAPHEIIVGSTRAFCGFERALVGMLPGEQRRVFVPWTLAFGEAGRPPIVPPRSDLVLVIDLFTPGGAESSSGAGPARPAGGGGRRR